MYLLILIDPVPCTYSHNSTTFFLFLNPPGDFPGTHARSATGVHANHKNAGIVGVNLGVELVPGSVTNEVRPVR